MRRPQLPAAGGPAPGDAPARLAAGLHPALRPAGLGPARAIDSPSAGPVDAAAATWPAWLQAGLRGIGQVVFVEHAARGVCLLLGVLLAERRAGLWLALGALIGTFAALGVGLAGAANGLHGFNPALAALASSQVQRGAAPLAAALLAALLSLAAHRYGWPALTLPFILACWGLRALAPVRSAQPQVSRGS
ncbi:urea transporter [Stutzerimonas balearica]|uniref:urea transporter n=1 Tax=Stutzerimonas balearica TaxID=74829 RepID=UPI00350FD26D